MAKEIRERLRASLWVLPAVASLAAFVAAKLLVALDRRIPQDRRAWYLFGGEADGARELLSTIASSMMTFTGLVFSITILVLQLASGQFSPRVLRTFLRDRHTHFAMGAFVGTFVFAMALIPEVRGDSAALHFVPAVSLFAAFVLVLIAVAVFIHYIDHMAHSVRAITVIKRVAAETHAAVRRMYPDELVEEPPRQLELPHEPPDTIISHEGAPGVLIFAEEEELIRLARGAGAVLCLVPLPGEFVPRGAPLVRVWGGRELDASLVRGAVAIDDERTIRQDPAFGFRQLVDVAERALSPSLNDPSTAVQVLDELHGLLRTLARRRFPSPQRLDEDGRLRLWLPQPDWSAYVRLALVEIREYGERSSQVMRRMRALIEDCLRVAPSSRRRALEEQLELMEARQ